MTGGADPGTGGNVLDLVLTLHRSPSLRFQLREQPLPPDIGLVLRLAAPSQPLLDDTAARLGHPPAILLEAARFYLQQVLFEPGTDAYRVLGVAPNAPLTRIRDHHRWLQRWLHPDRGRGGQLKSPFAARLNWAWQQLRNEDKRSAYDAQRSGHAQATANTRHEPEPHPRPVRWTTVPAPASARPGRWWRRGVLAAVFGVCVLLFVLVLTRRLPTPIAAQRQPVRQAATPTPANHGSKRHVAADASHPDAPMPSQPSDSAAIAEVTHQAAFAQPGEPETLPATPMLHVGHLPTTAMKSREGASLDLPPALPRSPSTTTEVAISVTTRATSSASAGAPAPIAGAPPSLHAHSPPVPMTSVKITRTAPQISASKASVAPPAHAAAPVSVPTSKHVPAASTPTPTGPTVAVTHPVHPEPIATTTQIRHPLHTVSGSDKVATAKPHSPPPAPPPAKRPLRKPAPNPVQTPTRRAMASAESAPRHYSTEPLPVRMATHPTTVSAATSTIDNGTSTAAAVPPAPAPTIAHKHVSSATLLHRFGLARARVRALVAWFRSPDAPAPAWPLGPSPYNAPQQRAALQHRNGANATSRFALLKPVWHVSSSRVMLDAAYQVQRTGNITGYGRFKLRMVWKNDAWWVTHLELDPRG